MSLREQIVFGGTRESRPRLSARLGAVNTEPTKTQQHHAKDTNINVIVERYGKTGILPVRSDAPLSNTAFLGIFDYMSAQNALVAADRAFAGLPASVRKRFANDPKEFIAFCENKENLPELRKMGLAEAEKPPVVEKVQKVEVVNPPAKP